MLSRVTEITLPWIIGLTMGAMVIALTTPAKSQDRPCVTIAQATENAPEGAVYDTVQAPVAAKVAEVLEEMTGGGPDEEPDQLLLSFLPGTQVVQVGAIKEGCVLGVWRNIPLNVFWNIVRNIDGQKI